MTEKLEDRMTLISYKLGDEEKLCIPEDSRIMFSLAEPKWNRLREWLDKNDHIEIATGKNSDQPVWLLNTTRIEKGKVRKRE